MHVPAYLLMHAEKCLAAVRGVKLSLQAVVRCPPPGLTRVNPCVSSLHPLSVHSLNPPPLPFVAICCCPAEQQKRASEARQRLAAGQQQEGGVLEGLAKRAEERRLQKLKQEAVGCWSESAKGRARQGRARGGEGTQPC
jgi:hypothetical protein